MKRTATFSARKMAVGFKKNSSDMITSEEYKNRIYEIKVLKIYNQVIEIS